MAELAVRLESEGTEHLIQVMVTVMNFLNIPTRICGQSIITMLNYIFRTFEFSRNWKSVTIRLFNHTRELR